MTRGDGTLSTQRSVLVTGILDAVPAADYHADAVTNQPTLNASIASILIDKTPAHAFQAHPKLNPNFERVEEDKFAIGTVAHALLLQGDDIAEPCDFPDWRTNAAKEARDQARAAGRIPLLTKDHDRVRAMVDAIRHQIAAHKADPPLLSNGKPEQTIVWQDRGVVCRARIDWLHDDLACIDDVKTTAASANPASWQKTMYGIGADVQARFYTRGIKILTGHEPDFRFVVAETSPPHAISVVSLDPSARVFADEKIDWALDRWKACLESGQWPAFTPRVHFIDAPAYEETRWLERTTQEAAA